jgi:hypothetical protein
MDGQLMTRSHRRAHRELLLLVAALGLVAATYVAQAVNARPAEPAPRTPIAAPGAQPASRDAASGTLTLPEQIAFWTRRVAEQPSDFLSLTQLAVAHAEQARLTFDVAGYDRASEAVERALSISPQNPATVRARAAIRVALHDFLGAATDARSVLAAVPDDAAALALLGDAQLELGSIDDARATYALLAEAAASPALDVRLARLAYLTGDPGEALRLARRALGAAPGEATERAFYAYAVGEYARLGGDAATARGAYELALSLRPDDLPALVGLARIEAFDGRTDAALDLLERAAAIAPQPEVLALTADLRRLGGDDVGADRAEATVRLTADLAAASARGRVFDRQLVQFGLDHGGPAAALLDDARLALDARSDASGHDLVGWAAYRAGRLDVAAAASEAALASGIRDARLLYHAGAIDRATGDEARGRQRLEAAIALGPALDPAEVAEARRLLAP